MNINENNEYFSNYLIENNYLKLKSKVKIIDCNSKLSLILLCEENQNIIVYNVNTKSIIKSFNVNYIINDNISNILSNVISISNLKLYDANFMINNCYLTDFNNHSNLINYNSNNLINYEFRGCKLFERNDIIILTLEKLIVFYSIYCDNILNYISYEQLEKKILIKAVVFDTKYLVVLTNDGKNKLYID